MAQNIKDAILPARLQPGDRVRFIPPASPVPKNELKNGAIQVQSSVLRFLP